MQKFFNYGRSVEGKLRMLEGSDMASSAPIMHAGWLDASCGATDASAAAEMLDVYGMSFSEHIADQMLALDPSLKIAKFAGPAAPLNHSYACFLTRLEARATLAPIQIIGVLASSVRRMATISGLTTSFEDPQPFTYPRFSVQAEMPVAYYSSVRSETDLRRALGAPGEWERFSSELQGHDYFYSPFIIQSDLLDKSTLGRMVRRAVGQHIVRDRTDALRPQSGFDGDPALSPTMVSMLVDFAARCTQRGVRPFVILIEDRGLGGSLTSAVGSALRTHRIEYLATSEIVSSSDSKNFLPDGHFVASVDRQIAREVYLRLGLVP